MPRLRHPGSGVVVNVSDGTAARLGWPSADPEPTVNDTPARSAPKAEWVDLAVRSGLDRDEAEGMTKADLFDLLG
jgi:hypothetical protein